MIKLRPEAYEAGREYAAALLEACAPTGTDPVKVLVDTEGYPKIVKKIEMAEFLVGWFHCAVVMTGATMTEIWRHLSAGLEVEGKGKEPRSRSGSKPNTSTKALPPAKTKTRRAA